MENEPLGKKLERIRTRLGWTLVKMAERSGLAKSSLHRFESDEPQPRLGELTALLDCHGWSLESFLVPQVARHGFSVVDSPLQVFAERILAGPGWSQLLWEQQAYSRLERFVFGSAERLLHNEVGLGRSQRGWRKLAKEAFTGLLRPNSELVVHVLKELHDPWTDYGLALVRAADLASKPEKVGVLDVRTTGRILSTNRDGQPQLAHRALRRISHRLGDELRSSRPVSVLVLTGVDGLLSSWPAEADFGHFLENLLLTASDNGVRDVVVTYRRAGSVPRLLETVAKHTRRDLAVEDIGLRRLAFDEQSDWIRHYVTWKLRGFPDLDVPAWKVLKDRVKSRHTLPSALTDALDLHPPALVDVLLIDWFAAHFSA